MDWAQLALDYIDTMVWPLAAASLVVLFRKNIAQLIDRIRSVKGPAGMGLDTTPAGPSDQSPIDPSGGAGADAVAGAIQDMAARYSEAVTYIAQTETDFNQLKTNYNALNVLYQFERIYRMIYGTQLSLLFLLRESLPDHKKTRHILDFFYDDHVRLTAAMPNYSPNREAYYLFLTNSQMVELATEAEGYQLTAWGGLFLNYVEQQNLPRDKAF